MDCLRGNKATFVCYGEGTDLRAVGLRGQATGSLAAVCVAAAAHAFASEGRRVRSRRIGTATRLAHKSTKVEVKTKSNIFFCVQKISEKGPKDPKNY